MLDGTSSHTVLSACGLIMANGSMGRLHIPSHHCPQSNKGFHCGSVRRYPPPRYGALHGTCGITLVRSTQTCPHHYYHACIAVSVWRRLLWEGWWGRDPLRHHMKDRLGVPPYASQKDGGWIESRIENREDRKVLMYCL
ncbi:hypothetical protein QQF64_016009 [Cirrhinus molitorella]|uniref:Uncharacterized protein n=1 Tax=Cirrhinus molitorella TaxID=172907 RepID=A0ABR3LN81_9TELE